jgi:diguanylate cyclase (GGDEF)-like protein
MRLTLERSASAPAGGAERALLSWRDAEATTLFLLCAVLIAVLFPAFYFITRALPDNVHDVVWLRFGAAGFSLLLAAAVVAFPRLRSDALRLQMLNATVFFIAMMVLLVESGNEPLYLSGTVVGLFGVQYAFLRWQYLAAAYTAGWLFEVVYSWQAHVLLQGNNLYALGVVFVASVVCVVAGTLRIRNAYAQARDRIRLETQAAEMRAQAEHIAHLAYSDSLTGLLNRIGLNERIDRTISVARRHGLRMALLYLDLDGFKKINDRYGHDAGDSALVEAALRMQYVLRNGETLARIGGDEFVVLMPVINSPTEPAQLAARMEEAFAEPFLVEEGQASMRLGVSIGLAVYPDDGETRLQLIAHADRAMYGMKRRRDDTLPAT